MIDLEKYEERKANVGILLEKYAIPEKKSKVKLFFDKSGSMSSLYKNGDVQEIFERILPLAAKLDDDGKMETYVFNDLCAALGSITLNNIDRYVENNINVGGGTNYEPIIKSALADRDCDIPTFAIVITDGDCYDKEATKKAVIKASKENVFFQFVGIGYERFAFLEKIDTMQGRYIDNAGFFKVDKLSQLTDKELYHMLVKEYKDWLINYKAPKETNETNVKTFFSKLFK